jgi:PPK2 family polyphosphate:nucleotide phosphotransferase
VDPHTLIERYRVPYDGTFSAAAAPTEPPVGVEDRKKLRSRLDEKVEELDDLQEVLYADDRYAVLCIFQALDAGGKDSTIRAVTTGVNPAGFQVFAFKKPSDEELDHDFLWRTAQRLPERGRIGIFNRSYYEEVLVVRVHPELVQRENLPGVIVDEGFWQGRYQSIREHEAHLAREGVVILKFWLNLSKDQQKRRILRRLNKPSKHWKFTAADLKEREHWDEYIHAYEMALRETSRSWAPWFAIPADDKPFARLMVATILVDRLHSLDLEFPSVSPDLVDRIDEYKRQLEGA